MRQSRTEKRAKDPMKSAASNRIFTSFACERPAWGSEVVVARLTHLSLIMKKLLKWTGVILGSLVVLLLLVLGLVYFIGSSNFDRVYAAELASLVVSEDSATVVRGAHLAQIYGCGDCHGADFSGLVVADEPPFRVTASNLTTAGPTASYSFEQLDAAIRHGIGPGGRALQIMPSSVYNHMSDDDVASIIAYLRALDPVESDLPPTEIRALGRILAAGPIDPAMEVRTQRARLDAAPDVGETTAYGEYLATVVCSHCHGSDFRGLVTPPSPGSPAAPDLVVAGNWPRTQFTETLRTGVTPSGHEMDPKYMPWTATAAMTDTELGALHLFLGSLGE